MLRAGDHLKAGPDQVRIDGHQVGTRRWRERLLLAVGTTVRIVIVPVGPHLNPNRTDWGRRPGTHVCADEGATDSTGKRYSSQPH